MLDQYYDRVRWLDSLIVDRAGKFYQQERDRQSYIKEYSDQLQRITRFLDLAGNPQNKFSSIHVAGTSGKGSVVSMLGAIMEQSGLTIGVHTSPYLQVCTEKLVINGKMISPKDFVELVDKVKGLHGKYAGIVEPLHYREAWTAMVCLWFAGMQVDWAVVETSIGGRYDTTNVLPSKMAIINNIGLEHIPQLGRNLKEIAWHKAGIIKQGQPVIIAEQNTEIVEIFQAEAKLKNTKLYCQGKDFQFSQPEFEGLSICFDVKTPHGSVQNIRLNQPGLFQAQNAATAIMAASLMAEKYKVYISEAHIRTALEKWSIPGRMEIMQHLPTVILDIAHNPQKMQALVDSIKLFHPGKHITFILGMLSMKDVSSTIKVLLSIANKIFFAPVFVSGKPCMTVKQLAEIVGKIDSTIQTVQCENVKDAINRALVYSKKDDLIIITGSLYMVGEARDYWMPAEKLLAGAEETAGE